MGATALGVKANASHFNRCGENWGSYNNCGWGNGFGYGYGFNGCCGANTVVNRFELEQSQRISELESDRATDNKLISLYSQTENKDIRSTKQRNHLQGTGCFARTPAGGNLPSGQGSRA